MAQEREMSTPPTLCIGYGTIYLLVTVSAMSFLQYSETDDSVAEKTPNP